MARIGIGATTYNRPECLAKWKEQIRKHTDLLFGIQPIGVETCLLRTSDVTLYIATDTDEDRQGVCKRKNECLRALKDCDHIFLFDDDTYPIKDGWIENFIKEPYDHLLYLTNQHKPMIHAYGSTIHQECGGVFMYMTKKAVDLVGAFDEKYVRWGLEHADYSKRIAMACGYQYPYRSLDNTSEYIYSHDYSDPNHKSSISNEEKQKYFNENFQKFKEPIKSIHIPL